MYMVSQATHSIEVAAMRYQLDQVNTQCNTIISTNLKHCTLHTNNLSDR